MSSRPAKRARVSTAGGSYHDRVPLQDDFEVIHSRSTTLSGRNVAQDSARSPLKGRTTWTVGRSWAPQDDSKIALDADGSQYDVEMAAEVCESGPGLLQRDEPPKPRIRSKISARPHVIWKEKYRQSYLDEVLRWEGCGDFRLESGCPDCVSRRADVPNVPEYRCRECFVPDLTCRGCCVKRHRVHPFHVIERWNGTCFVKTSLRELGLKIHLNHASLRCSAPTACHADFRVIHTNGIHHVDFSFCGCERSVPPHVQLLRRGLYPASQSAPRTCVTFSLLQLMHLLSLTAKTATYDIYRTLERLSDNTGLATPKTRYRPLLRTGLQWRHLKMLKRGGRGHDESGAEGMKEGELAVLCLSCPRPGVNIPADWENAPDDKKFLYAVLVCMDANFRLKNQLVSNYSTDPILGSGWAYMVKREPYEAYVLSQAEQEDISTCVGFQALAKALSRFARGLRYTGVGGAFCGRSEMVLPNGVGNLQKGERYSNMDYVFASAVKPFAAAMIIAVSYDIVCQWFAKLLSRMTSLWPSELRLPDKVKIRPLIPKFHAPAHNEKDHEQFWFMLAKGLGLADGECPERFWSSHNALGNSTKTQGPGSRELMLDDNFSFWNWLKYSSFGKALLQSLLAAMKERNKQTEAHRGFTESLPVELIDKWEKMCMDWDNDGFPKVQPNPYKAEEVAISEAKVREELELEEKASVGAGITPARKTTASHFLAVGLDLEEEQRRISTLAKEQGSTPTELQTTSLKDERSVLREKIRDWESVRPLFIPGILGLLAESANSTTSWDSDPNPEDVKLWLPSSIPTHHRRAACLEGLPEVEARLRVAQCEDASTM